MKKSILRYYQRKIKKLKTIILNDYVIDYSVCPGLRYITARVYFRKDTRRGSWYRGKKIAEIEALGPFQLSLIIGRQIVTGKFVSQECKIGDPMIRKEYDFWYR